MQIHDGVGFRERADLNVPLRRLDDRGAANVRRRRNDVEDLHVDVVFVTKPAYRLIAVGAGARVRLVGRHRQDVRIRVVGRSRQLDFLDGGLDADKRLRVFNRLDGHRLDHRVHGVQHTRTDRHGRMIRGCPSKVPLRNVARIVGVEVNPDPVGVLGFQIAVLDQVPVGRQGGRVDRHVAYDLFDQRLPRVFLNAEVFQAHVDRRSADPVLNSLEGDLPLDQLVASPARLRFRRCRRLTVAPAARARDRHRREQCNQTGYQPLRHFGVRPPVPDNALRRNSLPFQACKVRENRGVAAYKNVPPRARPRPDAPLCSRS